jgi:hypothetical protein
MPYEELCIIEMVDFDGYLFLYIIYHICICCISLAFFIEPGTVGTGFSGLSSTVDVNTAA